jgi:arylsulfatase
LDTVDVAYTAPHFPLHALKEDIAKYEGHYQQGWDVIRERRWKRQKQEGLVNCDLALRNTRTPPPVVLHTPEISDPLSILGGGEIGLAPPWTDLTREQKEFQALKITLHAAMVTRMDTEIGRVLDQLRAMGAMQNTVIFFASDNGACATIMVRGGGHDPDAAPGSADSYLRIGPGWASAANTPFRLHKVWTYEGGISTPLIMHWPAGIHEGGEIRHAPVHFIDIVPTLIELAGGKESDSRRNNTGPPLPGKSIVPCFASDIELPRDPIFLDQPTEWRSFWSKEDQLRYQDGAHGFRALITTRHKLMQPLGAPPGTWELYDMINDRSERNDLAGQMPQKVRELADTWNHSLRKFQREAAIP